MLHRLRNNDKVHIDGLVELFAEYDVQSKDL